jgi:hypothetical protein
MKETTPGQSESSCASISLVGIGLSPRKLVRGERLLLAPGFSRVPGEGRAQETVETVFPPNAPEAPAEAGC